MEFNKTLPSIYSLTAFPVSKTSGGDAYTVPTFGTVDLATALVTGNAAFVATLSLNDPIKIDGTDYFVLAKVLSLTSSLLLTLSLTLSLSLSLSLSSSLSSSSLYKPC